MFKKLISMMLTIMIIVAIPFVSVHADNKVPNPITDGRVIYEYSAGESEYKFKLDRMVECAFGTSSSGSEYVIKNVNSSTSYSYDVSGTYFMRLFPAGEYSIHISATSNGKFEIMAADGEFIYSENGAKETAHLSCFRETFVGIKGSGPIELSFVSYIGNVDLIAWRINNDSNIIKTETCSAKAGDYVTCSVLVNGVVDTYHVRVVRLGDMKLPEDTGSFYLVNKGGSFEHTYDIPKGDNINEYYAFMLGDDLEYFGQNLIKYPTLNLNNINDPRVISRSLTSNEGYEWYANDMVFVKDTSKSNILTEGTHDLDIYIEVEQKVFAFTPSKDDTYIFTSDADIETVELNMGVFDEADNLIASFDSYKVFNDGSIVDNEIQYKLAEGKFTTDMNLSLDLKGGQTYYFYFMGYDPTHSLKLKVASKSNLGGGFEDFVERLYVVALNRPSEKEGKDYWCELVGNGTLTGADCARFFLTSSEFKGRNLSDEDFLKVLYKTFFDRDAANDPDGFNFWMNSLKSVGKDTVVEGFINSPEWCDICATYGVKSGAPTAKATKASKNAIAFATRLYTECLGREPEEGGLKYWSLGLTNLELTGSQAAHEFFYSKEFNDHNFDNKELITRMYKTFMGREPDTDGLNYWLSNMNNGMTKDQVFNSFVQSQEFTEICAAYAIDRG
ncbi:MAG: DUF4214 domain-containing protein [Clostridiales bacterium]|nr:DUF4214 domain-containing protein [Clostridiales bacterium]